MGMTITKAVSIKPQSVSLIISRIKTLEVRSWRTHYRGPLLIVSSRRPRWDGVPGGMALGLTDLTDCRPMTASDEAAACSVFQPGAYVWVLTNARPLARPFAVNGRLSLYDVCTCEGQLSLLSA